MKLILGQSTRLQQGWLTGWLAGIGRQSFQKATDKRDDLMTAGKTKIEIKTLLNTDGVRCRIEWRVGGDTGHGEWHHKADKTMLQGHADIMNDKYGDGSHVVVDG